VAAGLAPIGIGSDTGGSVRIPAAFNGLVGLKVSFGRISLHGTALLSWSLDTIGPLGRSVDDCAQLLRALAGPDARDPQTLEVPALDLPDRLDLARVRGMRIAMPDADQLPPFMHPAVLAAWQDAAVRLERLGAHVVAVRLPTWHFELASAATSIIGSEAYTLHRESIEDPAQPIGEVFRERVRAATRLEIGGYAQALRLMGERRRAFAEWFRGFDAMLLPSVAIPAAPIDEIDEHGPVPAFLTRPANYLGLCALAMPAGLHEGLPLSVQIIGKPFAERTILEIGKAYQEDTGFHRLRPKVVAHPA
jgi:aspartyl-tRNA(Asn)/glutamyl-tRNA(Gln) amidotransferase subunit A